ncbi:MAG: hypothetical protein IJI66_08115 [Erysipelotrichaceae bacterium]|nr:hypothetical protein [Erysipelotrichaceae bacterium]
MKNYKTLYFLIFGTMVLICTIFLYYVEAHSNNYLAYSETSKDNRYILEIYQIDYAQKPYGPTPFKACLYDKEKDRQIGEFESMMYLDGRLLTKDVMDIEWNDDHVVIISGTVTGGIARFVISFNGDTITEFTS